MPPLVIEQSILLCRHIIRPDKIVEEWIRRHRDNNRVIRVTEQFEYQGICFARTCGEKNIQRIDLSAFYLIKARDDLAG